MILNVFSEKIMIYSNFTKQQVTRSFQGQHNRLFPLHDNVQSFQKGELPSKNLC
jgi:hypothetical protein